MKKESAKKRGLLDIIYSIGAIAVFNMVIQLALYPFLERRLGAEAYGVALSALSFVSITAGTLGTSANYSRMVSLDTLRPSNGDYNLIMLVGGALCALLGAGYLFYLDIASPLAIILFSVLILLSGLRYYSDVDFRMKSDFFRFFLYYLSLAVGYLLGMAVFALTGEWMTALIVGEGLGILFVLVAGTIYRKPLFRRSESFPLVCQSLGLLLFSNLIENLTLNADRLLLIAFEDGEAVAVYYTASLLGKVVAMLTVPINSIVISYLVKYKCALTKKFWTIAAGGVLGLGLMAFLGCTLVSPIALKLLYPSLYEAAKGHIVPAILGQVLYFVSGILLVILLKFRGEKKQFLFNVFYAIEFFALTVPTTALFGLEGFVFSSLIANAIRFVAVLLWGFGTSKKASV